MNLKALAWALGKELKSGERSMLITIADHADEDNKSHPSLERLAKISGMNTCTASRTIKKLIEYGLISVQRTANDKGYKSTNIYQLNLDNDEKTLDVNLQSRLYKKPYIAKSNIGILHANKKDSSSNNIVLNSSSDNITNINRGNDFENPVTITIPANMFYSNINSKEIVKNINKIISGTFEITAGRVNPSPTSTGNPGSSDNRNHQRSENSSGIRDNKNDQKLSELKKEWTDLFEKFWKIYPAVGVKKGNKQTALNYWSKINLNDKSPTEFFEIIRQSIQKQIQEREGMQKAGEKFIPAWKHASTWLNKSCWSDEIDAKYVKLVEIQKPKIKTPEEIKAEQEKLKIEKEKNDLRWALEFENSNSPLLRKVLLERINIVLRETPHFRSKIKQDLIKESEEYYFNLKRQSEIQNKRDFMSVVKRING